MCINRCYNPIMLKRLIQYLLVWRFLILIFAVFGVFLLPARECCQGSDSHLSLEYLANIWANFAGGDFIQIASSGYGQPHTYIFFPLFPQLIRLFTVIIPDYLVSGLVISHLSLVFALFFLYKLILLDHNEKIANLTLIILMVFPTAFFFGSVYTESFFLLLVVTSFYASRQGKYPIACLLALLASSTRFTGIFLWPAIVWEMWRNLRWSPALIWLSLPPLGLISYMRYLSVNVGDPLYFLKVSPDFGPNLIISKLILLHQVFYRYIKMLVFSDYLTPLFFTVILEFVVGVVFLVLVIFVFRKMRFSYAIYSFLAYLATTFTGSFAGLPRSVLTIFPAFILIAIWLDKQSPLIKRIFIGLNLVFSAVATILFTRGYFIG